MAGELRLVLGLSDAVARDVEQLRRTVAAATELVACQNSQIIRKLGRGRIPPLYSSRVVYRLDPQEWDARFLYWPTCDEIVAQRWCNCKGAVAYRLAELRLENPRLNYGVHTYARRNGRDTLIHLQIELPTGEIEDPSRLLPGFAGVPVTQ